MSISLTSRRQGFSAEILDQHSVPRTMIPFLTLRRKNPFLSRNLEMILSGLKSNVTSYYTISVVLLLVILGSTSNEETGLSSLVNPSKLKCWTKSYKWVTDIIRP